MDPNSALILTPEITDYSEEEEDQTKRALVSNEIERFSTGPNELTDANMQVLANLVRWRAGLCQYDGYGEVQGE